MPAEQPSVATSTVRIDNSDVTEQAKLATKQQPGPSKKHTAIPARAQRGAEVPEVAEKRTTDTSVPKDKVPSGSKKKTTSVRSSGR